MVHFRGTDYRSHTSCVSEAQKYQGALYKEKPSKQVKKSVKINPTTSSLVPRKAYVEDALDGDTENAITIVDAPPEAPTPPPAVSAKNTQPVNVFDFLVNENTPNASKISLGGSHAQMEMKPHARPLFNANPLSSSDSGTDHEYDLAYERHGYAYGTDPIPATSTLKRIEYQTPASKSQSHTSVSRDSHIYELDGAERISTDKKRKRTPVEELDLTAARPSSRHQSADLMMVDAPTPLLTHSGLTGGLNRLLSTKSTSNDKRPRSPEYSTTNDIHQQNPSPPSPVTRKKRVITTLDGDKVRKTESGALVRVRKGTGSRRASDESTRPRKQHRLLTENGEDRHRREGSTTTSSSHPAKRNGVKTIGYHPTSTSSTNGQTAANQMIVYRTRAELFLSFVNKGPESETGCSMNKALKRYHRERGERGLGKQEEEKALWKSLRVRRNERGEAVILGLPGFDYRATVANVLAATPSRPQLKRQTLAQRRPLQAVVLERDVVVVEAGRVVGGGDVVGGDVVGGGDVVEGLGENVVDVVGVEVEEGLPVVIGDELPVPVAVVVVPPETTNEEATPVLLLLLIDDTLDDVPDDRLEDIDVVGEEEEEGTVFAEAVEDVEDGKEVDAEPAPFPPRPRLRQRRPVQPFAGVDDGGEVGDVVESVVEDNGDDVRAVVGDIEPLDEADEDKTEDDKDTSVDVKLGPVLLAPPRPKLRHSSPEQLLVAVVGVVESSEEVGVVEGEVEDGGDVVREIELVDEEDEVDAEDVGLEDSDVDEEVVDVDPAPFPPRPRLKHRRPVQPLAEAVDGREVRGVVEVDIGDAVDVVDITGDVVLLNEDVDVELAPFPPSPRLKHSRPVQPLVGMDVVEIPEEVDMVERDVGDKGDTVEEPAEIVASEFEAEMDAGEDVILVDEVDEDVDVEPGPPRPRLRQRSPEQLLAIVDVVESEIGDEEGVVDKPADAVAGEVGDEMDDREGVVPADEVDRDVDVELAPFPPRPRLKQRRPVQLLAAVDDVVGEGEGADTVESLIDEEVIVPVLPDEMIEGEGVAITDAELAEEIPLLELPVDATELVGLLNEPVDAPPPKPGKPRLIHSKPEHAVLEACREDGGMLLLLVDDVDVVVVDGALTLPPPRPSERHRSPLHDDTPEGDTIVAKVVGPEVYDVLKPVDRLPASFAEEREEEDERLRVCVMVSDVVPEGIVMVEASVMVLVAMGGVLVPVLPRFRVRQRRPEHDEAGAGVPPGILGGVLVKDEEMTAEEVTVEVGAVDGMTLEEPPSVAVELDPSKLLPDKLTESRSEQPKGSVVVAGVAAVVPPVVIGIVDVPRMEVALDRTFNEALTQRRLVHPNGREVVEAAVVELIDPVTVGVREPPDAPGKRLKEALTHSRSVHPKGNVDVTLAKDAVVDVDNVDNEPVTDAVLEKRLRDALRQRRSVQPNDNVVEEG
ncbi:MAG: hypothetical protein Q9169_004483 [Polycauliona sp. 2 TL-2023]